MSFSRHYREQHGARLTSHLFYKSKSFKTIWVFTDSFVCPAKYVDNKLSLSINSINDRLTAEANVNIINALMLSFPH